MRGPKSLFEHLICPDCSSHLVFERYLECPTCGRTFPFDDLKVVLLPSTLSENDVAEERFWATDPKEGKTAPAWVALVMKKDELAYFHEKVMPNLGLGGKILEIGSGSCWLSALLKLAFPKAEVVASDVSISALDKGIQVGKLLGSKIDCYVACKVERIPFENEFFDFVIGSAVLHHSDPNVATKEIFRVLKKHGAYVGIGEFATPRTLDLLWKIVARRRKKVGLDVRNHSLNQWKRYIKESGFAEVSFNFERASEYKRYNWFVYLYYSAISRFPKSSLGRVIPCSIGIVANKRTVAHPVELFERAIFPLCDQV